MSSFPNEVDEIDNALQANVLARATFTLSLETLHGYGIEQTEEMKFQEAPWRSEFDVLAETQSITQATSRILEANARVLEANARMLDSVSRWHRNAQDPPLPLLESPATVDGSSAKKQSSVSYCLAFAILVIVIFFLFTNDQHLFFFTLHIR